MDVEVKMKIVDEQNVFLAFLRCLPNKVGYRCSCYILDIFFSFQIDTSFSIFKTATNVKNIVIEKYINFIGYDPKQNIIRIIR